jgi:serine/threonine-protein kinase
MESAPVVVGEVLAGKYRVDRVLGAGGMGVVVAATHVDLGQRVALKFLLPHALQNAEAAARFLREARAAVKIDSEHVARVIDVGRLENGAPYMVMEYLEGRDLSDHTKGPSLPAEDAVDFLLQACEAMAVAHTMGIVHRDLKPANLFLAQRPDGSPIVKVLDFGISKVSETDAPSSSLTQTSAVMGSPLYMSPEQMRSARNADARSDIWALGTILYELLTGEPPFNGETLGEVFAAVMTAEPRPPRALRPDLPLGLERVVLHALEKDPARRYANIGDLAAALQEFAPRRSQVLVERVSAVLTRAGVPMTVSSTGLAAAAAATKKNTTVASATNTAWEDVPAGVPKSSRAPIVIGFAVLLVGGLVGAAVLMRGGPAPAVAPESATAAQAPAPAAVPAPAATAALAPTAVAPNAPAANAPAVEPAAAPVVAPTPAAPPTVTPAHAPVATPVHPKVGARVTPEPKPTFEPPPAPKAPAAAPPPAPAPKKNPLSIDFK